MTLCIVYICCPVYICMFLCCTGCENKSPFGADVLIWDINLNQQLFHHTDTQYSQTASLFHFRLKSHFFIWHVGATFAPEYKHSMQGHFLWLCL